MSFGQGPNRRQWQWPRIADRQETRPPEPGIHTSVERRRHSYQHGPFCIDLRAGAPKTKQAAQPQDDCPLFMLPAEIRQYIYELVLQHDDGTVRVTKLPAKRHFAILQTCQRILYEAEMIFFASHRFQPSSIWHHLGETRRSVITAATIKTSSGGTAFSEIEQLHLFPNLKSLYIEREMSIRYLNISEWAIMWRQMQTELNKLQFLEEVKIFTPEASSALTPAEEERLAKLNRIDAELQRGQVAECR